MYKALEPQLGKASTLSNTLRTLKAEVAAWARYRVSN